MSLLTCQRDLQEVVITGNHTGGNAERLQIYRTAYYRRLIEILEQDYKSLAQTLGKRAFGELVRDYLAVYPSRNFTIREVGRYLPDYLKNHGGYDSHLVEQAIIEWAMTEVLFEHDEKISTLDELTRCSNETWSGLVFTLIKSHRLVGSLLIWRKQDRSVYAQELSNFERKLLECFTQNFAFEILCETMLRDFDEEDLVIQIARAIRYWMTQQVLIILF